MIIPDAEWLELILEAKRLGLSIEDIKNFIEEIKKDVKEPLK
ncbi:anti-repressor SinI family protein [Cytobacillus horneckiae]